MVHIDNNYYVNPLGEVTEFPDISYNNLSNYTNNKDTIKARINDEKKKFESKKLILTTWSIILSILILILIILIRNLN